MDNIYDNQNEKTFSQEVGGSAAGPKCPSACSPDNWSCPICLDLLYKPCVNSCGHTFCFWCMHHSMNPFRPSQCPLCRAAYAHFPRVCVPLHTFLASCFPEKYAERERENKELEAQQRVESPDIPLPPPPQQAPAAAVPGPSETPAPAAAAAPAPAPAPVAAAAAPAVPGAAEAPAPAEQAADVATAVTGKGDAAATPPAVDCWVPPCAAASDVALPYRCSNPTCCRLAYQPCILSCGCLVCRSCAPSGAVLDRPAGHLPAGTEALPPQASRCPHPRVAHMDVPQHQHPSADQPGEVRQWPRQQPQEQEAHKAQNEQQQQQRPNQQQQPRQLDGARGSSSRSHAPSHECCPSGARQSPVCPACGLKCTPDPRVCVKLEEALRSLYPDAYQQRQDEEAAASAAAAAATADAAVAVAGISCSHVGSSRSPGGGSGSSGSGACGGAAGGSRSTNELLLPAGPGPGPGPGPGSGGDGYGAEQSRSSSPQQQHGQGTTTLQQGAGSGSGSGSGGENGNGSGSGNGGRRERPRSKLPRIDALIAAAAAAPHAPAPAPSIGDIWVALRQELAAQADSCFTWYSVGCDDCGVFPIIGRRYRCPQCTELIGFDLCGACYDRGTSGRGRFNQAHTREHRMVKVEPCFGGGGGTAGAAVAAAAAPVESGSGSEWETRTSLEGAQLITLMNYLEVLHPELTVEQATTLVLMNLREGGGLPLGYDNGRDPGSVTGQYGSRGAVTGGRQYSIGGRRRTFTLSMGGGGDDGSGTGAAPAAAAAAAGPAHGGETPGAFGRAGGGGGGRRWGGGWSWLGLAPRRSAGLATRQSAFSDGHGGGGGAAAAEGRRRQQPQGPNQPMGRPGEAVEAVAEVSPESARRDGGSGIISTSSRMAGRSSGSSSSTSGSSSNNRCCVQ